MPHLDDPIADQRYTALQESAALLASIAGSLTPEQVTAPGYPREWTVAQVLSHVGSGAVIMQRGFTGATGGEKMPDDFAPSVWDEWNAKAPADQAADALAADRALVESIGALSASEQAAFALALGPFELDLAGAIGMRLNEHVLHTWDVEAALDPAAVLPADQAALVLENAGIVVQFSGKPTSDHRAAHVHTTEPSRHVDLTLGPDAVAMVVTGDPSDHDADLTISTEAFVRLVYGRLDPDHTPAFAGDADLLDVLRGVFPGF